MSTKKVASTLHVGDERIIPVRQNISYYNNLAERASQLNEYDLGATSDQFNDYLKRCRPELKKDVSNYCYVLIAHHQLWVDKCRHKIPYNPRVIPATDDTKVLTYNLSKLPEQLQRILVLYMQDCLRKNENNIQKS